MRKIVLAFLVSASATTAHAQTWSTEGNEALLPPSSGSNALQGVKILCEDGYWSMALPGIQETEKAVPVALNVDGKIFLGLAEGAITIAPAIVPALKAGKRFTVHFLKAGETIETEFSLKGSNKALTTLEETCGTSQVADPSFDPASGVRLRFPRQVEAGSELVVEFEGRDNDGDWIGIVPAGAKAGEYLSGAYEYAKDGSPVKISVPGTPGDYEVRFANDTGSEVVFSRPLRVAEVSTISLEGPDTAIGGQQVTVNFEGPKNTRNFVALVPAGSPNATQTPGHWMSVTTSPADMRVPAVAGDYELRYVLGVGDAIVIARKAITVSEPPAVTLSAIEATAGSDIEIDISAAPRTSGDYLYIARKGAPDDDYAGGYFGAWGVDKAKMKAPAESGEWEIRYVVPSNNSYAVLGRAPLLVK